MKKLIIVLFSVFAALFAATFTVYYLNLDMKLVHKLYGILGKHHDKLDTQKDRRL